MSPLWFNRRTYRIVASGRSALTFNAAMSASSPSTTIRSAFLLTLSPTVNGQDILAFLKAKLGCERALSSIDQTLRASLVLRGALRAHGYLENGADAGSMGITCYMVRPTARCMYWH